MQECFYPNQYLTYSEMLHDIETICATFPKSVDVEKIPLAQTPEGRTIIAIRIYPKGKQVEQPTLWMDANMHSIEFLGTNVVLAFLDECKNKIIQKNKNYFDVNYVFIPRMCPDGVENYFTTSRRSRSNARDSRPIKELGSTWMRECLLEKEQRDSSVPLFQNKNRIGCMRKLNEAGIWTLDEKYPNLIRRRELGDKGPFYDLYPEGKILNFDGTTVPAALNLRDNQVDLNRNFPTEWEANLSENNSGKIPLSEVESRAIAEFAASIPSIYFWLNYHTFGGVFIRPMQKQSDDAFSILDRSVFKLLDKKLEELTGYPGVSGFKEFTYIPGKPLLGSLSSFAYHGLGAFAYVCELWDLPARMGRTERPFVNRYEFWGKKEWRKLYEMDRDDNGALLFGHPWKKYQHPQLGEVEISEIPAQFGINNPPQKYLQEIIQNQLNLFPLLVELAPKVKLSMRALPEIEKNIFHLELTVANIGFLPTFGSDARNLAQGKKQAIVQVTEVNNGKLIGESCYFINELYGFATQSIGWLDSPDFGSNFSTTKKVKIPFYCKDKNLQVKLKVSFPFAGDHFITFGD